MSPLFYKFCYLTFPVFFRIFLRLKVLGRENIPDGVPLVIASNHLSLWDPPVLGASATRPVHFMAKAELFRPKFFGWIISKLGVFPVRRGAADRQAIATGIGYLKNNEVVAVFPEGTRSKTGELGHVGSGAFFMAAKSKAVIVPAYINGTDTKRHKGWPKVTVIFGRPIEYDKSKHPGKEELDEIGEKWKDAVLDLKKAVVENAGNAG